MWVWPGTAVWNYSARKAGLSCITRALQLNHSFLLYTWGQTRGLEHVMNKKQNLVWQQGKKGRILDYFFAISFMKTNHARVFYHLCDFVTITFHALSKRTLLNHPELLVLTYQWKSKIEKSYPNILQNRLIESYYRLLSIWNSPYMGRLLLFNISGTTRGHTHEDLLPWVRSVVREIQFW